MNKKVSITCPYCGSTLKYIMVDRKKWNNALYEDLMCPYCPLFLGEGYTKTLQYLDKIPKIKNGVMVTNNTKNQAEYKCPVCKKTITYLHFKIDTSPQFSKETKMIYSCPKCGEELATGYVAVLEGYNTLKKKKELYNYKTSELFKSY
ncbi:MAG: hypothetical protein QW478_05210 [Candidatus Micrarchaeaceae archaeon]